MSELLEAGRNRLEGFKVLKLVLDPPREQLYERINARARRRVEEGLVEEVEAILARGYAADCRPLGSLGYRQALLVVRGELGVEEAIEGTARETRRYAKRQRTWFGRDRGVERFAGFGGDRDVQEAAGKRVVEFLEGPGIARGPEKPC
jgi:tRNA dimethylallyltransferase